ncbi:MAG: HPr family phosphocarrier protein [Eubacteriales bacterium]
MKQFTYIIKDRIGIHARPATILAQEARKFECEIILEVKSKRVQVKDMMKVMSMTIKQGTEVLVTAKGSDEDAAIKRFAEIMRQNM